MDLDFGRAERLGQRPFSLTDHVPIKASGIESPAQIKHHALRAGQIRQDDDVTDSHSVASPKIRRGRSSLVRIRIALHLNVLNENGL